MVPPPHGDVVGEGVGVMPETLRVSQGYEGLRYRGKTKGSDGCPRSRGMEMERSERGRNAPPHKGRERWGGERAIERERQNKRERERI